MRLRSVGLGTGRDSARAPRRPEFSDRPSRVVWARNDPTGGKNPGGRRLTGIKTACIDTATSPPERANGRQATTREPQRRACDSCLAGWVTTRAQHMHGTHGGPTARVAARATPTRVRCAVPVLSYRVSYIRIVFSAMRQAGRYITIVRACLMWSRAKTPGKRWPGPRCACVRALTTSSWLRLSLADRGIRRWQQQAWQN